MHEAVETAIEKKPVDSATIADPGANNVDRIRDILFGTQIKLYEARFSRMEESLARETSEIKENARKRFESLESYFKREVADMGDRLAAEREDRLAHLNSLSLQLRDSSEALARRLSNLEDKSARADSGLRSELMDESQKLFEEIRRRHADLSGVIERRVAELRHDKTDRVTMAALLTEVAMRLSDSEPVPGGE